MIVATLVWIFSYVLQLPSVEVRWLGVGSHDGVKIAILGEDEFGVQCISSGLELRYRFEIQYCERYRFWLNDCSDEYRRVHSLQYNPITKTFRVMTDRLDDDSAPIITNVESEVDAYKTLKKVPQLFLRELKPDFDERVDRENHFLRVRVLTHCKSDNSRTLERLSYVLSLGLVRTSGYDSGWISFPLDELAE